MVFGASGLAIINKQKSLVVYTGIFAPPAKLQRLEDEDEKSDATVTEDQENLSQDLNDEKLPEKGTVMSCSTLNLL